MLLQARNAASTVTTPLPLLAAQWSDLVPQKLGVCYSWDGESPADLEQFLTLLGGLRTLRMGRVPTTEPTKSAKRALVAKAVAMGVTTIIMQVDDIGSGTPELRMAELAYLRTTHPGCRFVAETGPNEANRTFPTPADWSLTLPGEPTDYNANNPSNSTTVSVTEGRRVSMRVWAAAQTYDPPFEVLAPSLATKSKQGWAERQAAAGWLRANFPNFHCYPGGGRSFLKGGLFEGYMKEMGLFLLDPDVDRARVWATEIGYHRWRDVPKPTHPHTPADVIRRIMARELLLVCALLNLERACLYESHDDPSKEGIEALFGLASSTGGVVSLNEGGVRLARTIALMKDPRSTPPLFVPPLLASVIPGDPKIELARNVWWKTAGGGSHLLSLAQAESPWERDWPGTPVNVPDTTIIIATIPGRQVLRHRPAESATPENITNASGIYQLEVGVDANILEIAA